MEIRYNEETGTAAIEEWLIPTIRGLAKLKCDLTLHIKYEAAPQKTEPKMIEQRKSPKPKPSKAKPVLTSANTSIEHYPENMTVNQLMECLNVGPNRAYKLVTSGEIESFMIGSRNRRILKSSVINYIEKGKHKVK